MLSSFCACRTCARCGACPRPSSSGGPRATASPEETNERGQGNGNGDAAGAAGVADAVLKVLVPALEQMLEARFGGFNPRLAAVEARLATLQAVVREKAREQDAVQHARDAARAE